VADVPASVADYLRSLLYTERTIAYFLVDSSLMLIHAGGDLASHGLESLEIGRPACEQVGFLEGLLPLAESPFLLKAVQTSPERAADVHLFSNHEGDWVVLIDVTAEHEQARRMQQKAYDMTLLSEREARLIRQLEAANLELQRTYRALETSRETLLRTNHRLAMELEEAANYIRSILPPALSEPFVVEWRFVPSTELGGDFFGYHWIDEDHFVLYVLDVSGHGIGAALLSVAVANTLRSEALAGTDFRDPAEVLTALNQAYLMENHNNLFLTIWYGVYHQQTRRLEYASAGHPPALLLHGRRGNVGQIEQLQSIGPILGIESEVIYRSQKCTVPFPSRLFLFSDGAYEIQKSDGTMLKFSEFLDVLVRPLAENKSELDYVLEFVRGVHGPGPLEDDFSMVKFEFSEIFQ